MIENKRKIISNVSLALMIIGALIAIPPAFIQTSNPESLNTLVNVSNFGLYTGLGGAVIGLINKLR